MKKIICQLCVCGAGSAGIGAAIAASRQGIDTVLLEKDALLGGTSVNAGVNCWEPVAGATGIPCDIYSRLQDIPKAVGIYSFGRHCCHQQYNNPPFPGGENIIKSDLEYSDTLHRSGTKGIANDSELVRKQFNGVVFESEAVNQVAWELLQETAHCHIMTSQSIVKVESSQTGKITLIETDDGTQIQADCVIDCCGVVSALAGAELLRGEEPHSRFNEQSAPKNRVDSYNAVSLIFRCTPVKKTKIEPLPDDISMEEWRGKKFPPMCCTHYPNGDLNCNMLPTMTGVEYLELGEKKAYIECRRRVKAYWHYIQTEYPEFRNFRLLHIFPRLGIRETFRVLCEYMLNENDLLQGIEKQTHNDIIALSDHMIDSHGTAGKAGGELNTPYGIPYRCLIPKGFKNLLVAGRCAGFSSIAASSCRLSRTMMMLGQAAGTAASLAVHNINFSDINTVELQEKLRQNHVQLKWPISITTK